MLKSYGKGETLISCDVIFRFYCYSVFSSSEDCQELNIAKSRVVVFKIAANCVCVCVCVYVCVCGGGVGG